MTRKIQKVIEKHFTEYFAKFMQYNWDVIIPDNEKEYPDLLIKSPEGEFGLEVRELFKDERNVKGSKLKKTEQHNIQMMQKLASKYYNKSNNPIDIKLYGKLDEQNFNKILSVLHNNIVNQHKVLTKKLVSANGLISITITGLPTKFKNYSDWKNISDNIGFLGSMDIKSIEEIIKKKAKNLTKYSQNLKNVSLLLYCEHLFNSGKIRFQESMKIQKYGFQYIYLYEHLLNGYKY